MGHASSFVFRNFSQRGCAMCVNRREEEAEEDQEKDSIVASGLNPIIHSLCTLVTLESFGSTDAPSAGQQPWMDHALLQAAGKLCVWSIQVLHGRGCKPSPSALNAHHVSSDWILFCSCRRAACMHMHPFKQYWGSL